MEEKNENQNLPDDMPEKKKNKLRVKINNALAKKEETAAYNDVIFYTPLKEEEKDETAPLHKGSIDMWFLLWAMLLICFGAVMSYSASAVFAEQRYDSSMHFFIRYIAVTVAAAIVTTVFVIFARPWFWRVFGVGAYAVSVLLLIVVLFAGRTGGGAQRWIEIGPITIQPSEIAKMAVVMVLALYLSKHEKQVNSTHKFGGNFKHGFFVPMIIIGILCGLIALQPHLSGLMIVGMIGVAVMYLGGTRLKWLLTFLGIILVAGIVFISFFGYTMERINIWWNIDEVDPLGEAWQTLQGLYAIGSGGFFGLGLGSSRQKYGYVSQPQNDFIFTIICEELGFIGAFALMFLFGLLIWRGIKIGQNAPDKFCALTVWGLTFKIALQVLMNIAVVTNSMPNTGVSLPFISSGGSSLMLQIFEIGIILSISRFSTQKK
ncbi:MAG: cell division protein FtsW [Clostridia bacterium]|nr:cell division protein FtsW [Clostridia bacterium]